MDLEELIYNCKKGERHAQAELYRRYSGILFGMCLKYSKNRTEAEDNLHDSFMTIFSKIDQYSFQGSFEGWIKRITVNTVLQKYRKEQYLDVVSENMGDDPDLELDIEQADISLSTLLGYIQELPNKYRLTFNLYVLDGYSHKEISEMLGTSTGTSKSNLARAKMILREKIEKKKINIA
ncbi:RNA polymerase sigma factor [Flagellimonas olearia]|uniref:RNA polymerase sigma-70 factor n=1 Tax=Flagellimonas olearia TaxID=552546 RepID=A0A444VP30_9FLAO|nr:sigma-70 family RNA polymerase sigma factor [Allomuricauda olearia]RYC52442.1 RNA polymerase sigma-70 factor [Allomuricauda olearia]